MFVFVIIILIVVGIVLYKKSLDSPYVRERCKNRTPDQKKVIRYFCNPDGCMSKRMSDDEYEQMLLSVINSMDFKKKAISKIGLDESELNEIAPVCFQGPLFYKKSYSRLGKDNLYRSSAYQISWIFFSSTQVYLYQYTFNMDEDGKKELTEEYFYKDITNFSTSSDTVETLVYDPKQKKDVLISVDSHNFTLASSGGRLSCSLRQTDDIDKSIQGMKAKLREKKA